MTTEPEAIDENLTQADLDAATEANRAILQERFPTFDLSVGGPIDSLLVDGNAVISARNDADVDQAFLFQQLQAISNGEVTVEDADVDRLMANYFLTRRDDTPATGTVVFVVRDNINYSFQSGYRLRTANQSYQLGSTFSVYPVGTTGIDFSIETNVEIQQVFDSETGFEYRFEIPIESIEATPDAVLVAGDRLTVDQGFDGLGFVEAVTNFSGGFAAETNAEFVSRALEGITALTVSGQDNIQAVAEHTVQRSDANTIGTGHALMTRDRDNVFNLPTGGKIDVYVKSGAIAQTSYSDVTAIVQDDVARTLRITLTREQSAGVYRTGLIPLFLSTPPTIVSGTITVDSITHVTWTDPDGFNPELPEEVDRAFSARQQIQIDFTDDRQDGSGFIVTLTAPGQEVEDTYQVTTEYQPSTLEQDTAMTSDAFRPPGTDVLVKAAVPAITTVGVVAQKPIDYNGPDGDSLAASLVSEINQLPVRTVFVDSLTIAALLRNIESTLTVQSVSLNATIYGQDGTNISISPVGGRLSIPTNTTSKVSPGNTYFTTDSERVTVTLV